jgi:hypothetical protein
MIHIPGAAQALPPRNSETIGFPFYALLHPDEPVLVNEEGCITLLREDKAVEK